MTMAKITMPTISKNTPVLLMIDTSLHAVDVEDRDHHERDGRHPDLVVQARGVEVPAHVVEGRQERQRQGHHHGGHGEDPGEDVDPPREPGVAARPARYLVHWKTDPAMGKWLETSAKFRATMNWPSATMGQLQMKTPPSGDEAEAEQGEDARSTARCS